MLFFKGVEHTNLWFICSTLPPRQTVSLLAESRKYTDSGCGLMCEIRLQMYILMSLYVIVHAGSVHKSGMRGEG